MSPRDRLERAATLAGYGPPALYAIAEAALPRYQAPGPLAERHFNQVRDGVEVFAQAGLLDHEIPSLIASFKATGRGWQGDLWSQVVRVACLRFNHPDAYGLSPCEDDPERLQTWGTPAAQSALALARTSDLPAAA